MEIETVGRFVATLVMAVVFGWLLYALMRLIQDGIRFRRGMRAQLEANRVEIARAAPYVVELHPSARADFEAFPLAAPVIDRVRGMNTPNESGRDNL